MIARAVLFDVNHTLVGVSDEASTQSAAVDVLFGQVARLADSPMSRAAFRASYDDAWSLGKRRSFEEYAETRYEDIVSSVLTHWGVELSDAELESVLQTYMEPLYDAAYAIPGVPELLQGLRPLVSVGAITNYKYATGMRGLLARVGLTDGLNAISISSEVGWKKPSPRIYDDVLTKLGVSAGECIAVGNELEKDLWTAGELGMRTVLFHPEEHSEHDQEFAAILRDRLASKEIRCDFVAGTVDQLSAILMDNLV